MISLDTVKVKPKSLGKRLKTSNAQVRLRALEWQVLEQTRLRDLESGHSYATTLSAWVRQQIQPLLCSSPDKHPCQISKNLYQKIEELARLLNKSPEVVIGECVAGIENLILHTNAQRPLIVAEWRLRHSYHQSRNEDL